MTIRDAVEADIEAVVDIFNATVPTRLATAVLEPVSVEERVEWFHEHSPDRHPLWVAELDARIAGWLSFHSFITRCAYRGTAELSVYIHEGFRRRGVARALLADAIAESPRLGITALTGLIMGHNTASLRLFEQFGFERWGVLPRVARLDGVERDIVIVGRHISAAPATPPMLKVEQVSKKFRAGNFGVRDVSLELTSGVIGLVGPNGAGKTTLMQMIATVTRPSSGRITFRGTDITKSPNELRRQLGYLPQDFGVYDNLTAVEFLTYFAALKGVHGKGRIKEMLEMVNLHSVAHRTVGGFSGGMKQRLGIAQALINDPALVIVDEPTAGLDPEERVRFRNVLSEIGFGKLVILSTHIVSDIESIATEIAVMKEGALLTMAAPEVLLRGAEGKVWQSVVSSEEFDRLRTTLKISSAIRKPDGVHIRFVGPEPAISASAAEPELEDAFLYLMNFGVSA